jgi:ABC-type sugar transport system permease subunit
MSLPLALYLAFVVVPAFASMLVAFTDWTGLNLQFNFVGLKNFVDLFQDTLFFNCLKNLAIWLAGFILIPTLLGLALAALLDGIKGEAFFKTVFYLPCVIAFIIAAVIFRWIYLPDIGVLNTILRAIHLGGWQRPWLADPRTVTLAMLCAGVWLRVGFCMVLYLAGLRGVPAELVEQSRVDGASVWKSFRHVIFPLLRNTTGIIVVLNSINSMRNFDIVFGMTRGAPFGSSHVMETLMFERFFEYLRAGNGSAIATIEFLLCSALVYVYMRLIFKADNERAAG